MQYYCGPKAEKRRRDGGEGEHMIIVVLIVVVHVTIGCVHVASVGRTVLGTRPKVGSRKNRESDRLRYNELHMV